MERKARKEHRCSLCNLPIAAGEVYEYQDVRPWDHPDNEGFGTYKAHLLCNAYWCRTVEQDDWTLPDPHEFRREMQQQEQEANPHA